MLGFDRESGRGGHLQKRWRRKLQHQERTRYPHKAQLEAARLKQPAQVAQPQVEVAQPQVVAVYFLWGADQRAALEPLGAQALWPQVRVWMLDEFAEAAVQEPGARWELQDKARQEGAQEPPSFLAVPQNQQRTYGSSSSCTARGASQYQQQ